MNAVSATRRGCARRRGRLAPGAWRRAILLQLLVLAVSAPTARAQLPFLDELPFWTPADTLAHRASRLEATRFGDGHSGWTADRVLVDIRLPFGSHGAFLVRLPWVRFDSGGLSALERWPTLAGAETTAGWPGESVLSGFGQVELGAAGPVRLPWLGAAAGSIAVGVPLGQSRFYPWSSAGIPARVGLTRTVGIGSRWWATAGAVFVTHGGPGDEELGPEAFPNGWHTRLEILRRGGVLDLQAAWERRARGDRVEQVLVAEAWAPWGGGNRVGLRLAREITGSPDRAAGWAAGVLWRLAPRSAPDKRAPGATAKSR
ncbi:MAG: hypothetical protein IPH86_03380 [bacterium]|nr:hypothetical protein [bacterium]